MKRVIYVEDTYGVGFHKSLLEKLESSGYINISGKQPSIKRLHAKKCNPAIYRKILGALLRTSQWKVLLVIDSEGKRPDDAAQNYFLKHIKNKGQSEKFQVVVVSPRHEAWLCLGLGGSRDRCRSRPELYIENIIGKPYEKSMLEEKAGMMKLDYLLNEDDFRDYIKGLKWLISDP